jgi:2-C-methyl-D-erythritol 4-phosphate cytidylyltransferase/2-C-methyl-D-erythritol 2,4-cyclodiphosphate synthase
MRIAALIVAAGRGTRAGGPIPKQWQTLLHKRVIDWTIQAFQTHGRITHIAVVLHPDDMTRLDDPGLTIAQGGDTRDQSVKSGLMALAQSAPDYVLIHDAARASVTHDVIDGVIAGLATNDGAAPAIAVTDALWIGAHNVVVGTQDRTNLFRAQTPQGFHYAKILDAHSKNTAPAADDVEIARRANLRVAITQGCETNIKITTPDDFARVEDILRTRK